jgi:hypothetical protein
MPEHICFGEVVCAFGRADDSQQVDDSLVDGAACVRLAALRKPRLSFEKSISIGFISGEYLGRKKSFAPAALMARRIGASDGAAPMRAEMSMTTTMSPGCKLLMSTLSL